MVANKRAETLASEIASWDRREVCTETSLKRRRSIPRGVQQEEAAEALVRSLRERGVREIMVYDDHHRLRIQALGSQPARVVR
jgi:hypothetical protein